MTTYSFLFAHLRLHFFFERAADPQFRSILDYILTESMIDNVYQSAVLL